MDSPRARAIRAAVDVARADALTVGRWPNPRLTLDRESVAGVSETLMTVLQPLPITGRRSSNARRPRAAWKARRGVPTRRCAARGPICGSRTRPWWRHRCVSGSSTGRATSSSSSRGSSSGEAAGDAAGFDRLRAEREVIDVEADLALAAADRAQAQARLAAFLPPAPIRRRSSPRSRRPRARPASARGADGAGGTSRGELLALQKDTEAASLSIRAADRRRFPEPEVHGRHQVVERGRRRHRQRHRRAGHAAALRPRRARARARAGARRPGRRRSSMRSAWRCAPTSVPRACAAVERRRAAERYRAAASTNAGEVERIAQVSYDAGERGILELLDAYPHVGVRATAAGGARRRGSHGAEIELEFVSGWEIP